MWRRSIRAPSPPPADVPSPPACSPSGGPDLMTEQTVISPGAPGRQSHAEAQDDLWDLRNLAEATRLCDFQFEQVPEDFGRSVLEVGAGIGTFSERLLAAG